MSDEDKDKKIAKDMTRLMTRLEMEGVATVQVRDGRVFAFSRKKLQELIDSCDKAGSDKVILFIKQGVDEGPSN